MAGWQGQAGMQAATHARKQRIFKSCYRSKYLILKSSLYLANITAVQMHSQWFHDKAHCKVGSRSAKKSGSHRFSYQSYYHTMEFSDDTTVD